ncbi:MAG: uracil-DNA glycosylase [Methanomassiliicoccales archaeon]|nr:uracil-DNA glycosylase [Methanomassiliicoccales archaeon]NYT14468.1 uracil-DNA glycosylase [Methanomassiliicoccales archaeon]
MQTSCWRSDLDLDLECRRCPLSEWRTKVVAPDGDVRSPVCFVGEAPGKNEDAEGRPFVGRAGKMLDRLLEDEGLPRNLIMITNTVKCRPPNNRVPTREEREACSPYLQQELRGRKLIVGLGRTACGNLMGKDVRLMDEANVVTKVMIGGEQVEFLPTYHPAACLFNLRAREGLREAIRLVRDHYI